MPECLINGVSVNFPFEPYDVQKDYMAKVIECLQSRTNGMLESPTGTGKTLSLLCSTLAWILTKKAQVQTCLEAKQKDYLKEVSSRYGNLASNPESVASDTKMSSAIDELNMAAGLSGTKFSVPKVIYASRTHSQLSQAIQELKRSSYSFMNSLILGSRDQLCIHPDVSKETNNSSKIQLCKLHIMARTCSFYTNVESNKTNPQFHSQSIMDIEDLVIVGRKLRTCPYYVTRELIQNADIVFMPYNYLLDPKARKANKIDLNNTIVILDEAHNVEKMCEEAASIQIKSSDIALCIDDVTYVMKEFSDDTQNDNDDGDSKKDFTVDDLALLKEMLLDVEKTIDSIEVTPLRGGTTFPGSYIFELLAKANITHANQGAVNRLLDSLIQFLAAATQNSLFKKGAGLQILSDLLTIVFAGKDKESDEKIKKCFKVHVDIEEVKQQKTSTKKDGWITPKTGTTSNSRAKVINYWCFNPGYGMEQLVNANTHCIILTSGTLAPLKPLIAELSIPISITLENPHIVGRSQVCVKVVPFGPDKETLTSNYANRDNPKYINSLGRTILSFCPVIPDGLLIFFPSYPLMNKCIDSWQASGLWSQINRRKQIFVEPRGKDAFLTTMSDFYERINDPETKGACFMAVCRGKVSEGLDFADMNGRAVIITGLPYPPLKDPRIILKKKYLEDNRTKENQLLTGDGWYGLEAIRAVNQAIGRVIRHKNDYGAILLCDSRFGSSMQKSQLSSWIQTHLTGMRPVQHFGQIIGDLAQFFRNAQNTLPKPAKRELKPIVETDPVTEVTSYSIPNLSGELRKTSSSTPVTTMKIENANQVLSWHPNEYKDVYENVIRKQGISSLDFGSRLETGVTTIDFYKRDITQEPNETQISPSLVTIHKRDSADSQAAKRRRLKLVANDQPIEDSTSTSSSACSFVPSPLALRSPAKVHTQQQDIPQDRSELLKLIKSSVDPIMYNAFVKALMAYQKDNNIENLISVLAKVFHHSHLDYLLRGMKRFMKGPTHKEIFEEYLSNRST